MLQGNTNGFHDAANDSRVVLHTTSRQLASNPLHSEGGNIQDAISAHGPRASSIRPPEQAYLKDYGGYSESAPSIKESSEAGTSISSSGDDRSLNNSFSAEVERRLVPERVYTAGSWHPLTVITNFKPFTGLSNLIHDEKQERVEDHLATTSDLNALTDAFPLPQLTGRKCLRELRYHYASAYRRLWVMVIAANVAVIAAMISRTKSSPGSFTYGNAATATGANLLVAALMRHEHTINMLFHLATALPLCTPLSIRRQAAKVYSYGGVHSGAGISAFLWYCFYAVLAVTQFKSTHAESVALAATIAATLLLLAVIVFTAHPDVRRRWHNQWEVSHRYSGWTAIGLVWAQTLIIVVAHANHTNHSISRTLIATPTFWFLLIITICLIYPWLRLRRRNFSAERLSPHAVRLHFQDKTLSHCVGYRVSHRPLIENHGFATIPNANGEKGYSIVVSNAGDWTKSLINNPPTHIWTRGAPTIGVMRIASLFRPIVVVATGSGIGPCLSFLQVFPHHPMRIIWSARFPESTYGAEIMNAVLRADERAVIIDTKKTGHPDLPALTYAMYRRIGAEAIVIISNPTVTKKVVYEMECRRVPAFGAIFDS